MKTYQTFLPIFTGFYCNNNFDYSFELNDEITYIHQQRDANKLNVITDIELNVDDEKFNNDVSKELCEYIESEFNTCCTMTKIKVKFESLHSPKYYNFSNDSINCEIECDVNKLLEICQEHLNQFDKYIKSNFTSYDGFISWHSDNINDWLDIEYINENTDYRIGALLDFICKEICDIQEPSLYDLEIYVSQYITNLDEYLTKQIWNDDEVVCFSDIENFEKGCFWFHNWSELRKENYQFDSNTLTIQFADLTKNTMNQLSHSPLIDFEYTICELELT